MIRDGIILVLDARSSSAEFKLLALGDDNALDPRVNGQIEGIGYVRPVSLRAVMGAIRSADAT